MASEDMYKLLDILSSHRPGDGTNTTATSHGKVTMYAPSTSLG